MWYGLLWEPRGQPSMAMYPPGILLTQLSYEVDQDKASGQEVATTPGSLDVVPLLIPLEPHADAVLQEGADETQAGKVRQVLFGYTQKLEDRKTVEACRQLKRLSDASEKFVRSQYAAAQETTKARVPWF